MTTEGIHYNPAYVEIGYPNGDVPEKSGVCADVVIRSFRQIGMDLQQLIHESMSQDFSSYPALWALSKPDPHIDHRRVPNLMTYFQQNGRAVSLSPDKKDYLPCDIVAWDLGRGITHIGIVSDRFGASGAPLILHHIAGQPSEVDSLFQWEIIGHFRMSEGEVTTGP